MDNEGKAVPFPISEQESLVTNVIEPMAQEGLRTISVAYKDYVPGNMMLKWIRIHC